MFRSTMNLLEKMFTGVELCVIANIILDAQKIHEGSWNEENHSYRCDMMLSTKLSVEKHCKYAKIKGPLIHFLSDLNDTYWNEAQEWATNIINRIEDPLGIVQTGTFEYPESIK